MAKIECGDCPLVDIDVYGSCYQYCERMKARKESDYQQGRADAIDECMKAIVNTESKVFNPCADKEWDVLTLLADRQFEIINILKQLKEQKKTTCFDCKHHFMSDCYLECAKHNRINDDNICNDFEQLK